MLSLVDMSLLGSLDQAMQSEGANSALSAKERTLWVLEVLQRGLLMKCHLHCTGAWAPSEPQNLNQIPLGMELMAEGLVLGWSLRGRSSHFLGTDN